ncbi:MAG: hypothetical protein ACKOJI_09815, partial [Phycisphaerales bacterium]
TALLQALPVACVQRVTAALGSLDAPSHAELADAVRAFLDVHGMAVQVHPDVQEAAMRPGQASGDGMRSELVKRGEAPHQGGGFLEDGTMVVVDHGAGRVGSAVEVVVTNTVQTSAGRLVFARLASDDALPTPAPTVDADLQEAPAPTETGDAPAVGSAVDSRARAATAQPRTPPRPGHEPAPSRRPRNPRR